MKNDYTNEERQCTMTYGIEKFVLSQIKPQAPLLVALFRQCLKVSALRPNSPWITKTLISQTTTTATATTTTPHPLLFLPSLLSHIFEGFAEVDKNPPIRRNTQNPRLQNSDHNLTKKPKENATRFSPSLNILSQTSVHDEPVLTESKATVRSQIAFKTVVTTKLT